MISVAQYNGHLAYLVKYECPEEKKDAETVDFILVRADGFRLQYPELVLAYYDKRVYLFEPGEFEKITSDRMGEKAAEAYFASRKVKETLPENNDSSDDEAGVNQSTNPKNKKVDKFGLPLNYDEDHSSDSSLSSVEDFVENLTVGIQSSKK